MIDALLEFDQKHIIHPYTRTILFDKKIFIKSVHGLKLELVDGTKPIDGMSS